MRQYLLHLGERLRASFWLLPALMMAAAMGLAYGLQILGRRVNLRGFDWITTQDPDSARSLLATIASSTISVAGTVFSITIVALALAAGQFGPRLVRNFMRDRGTQTALGIFLSTFVYALVTMRGINGSDSNNYDIAVQVAMLLVLISIAFLIYFIHNLALSIQVDNITHNINRDFSAAIDRLYPSARDSDESPQRCDHDQLTLGEDCMEIFGERSGYVQLLDRKKLMAWAIKHRCCIHMQCHPGAYLNHWSAIASVYQPPRELDNQAIAEQIRASITLGPLPAAEQDIVYSIRQLGQIAVRALSPGINDPFTAYSCIDRLVDGIGKILQRPQLSNCFSDERGHLRLITCELDFAHLLAAAFDEIREYGRGSGVVMRHLLNSLVDLANICSREDDKRALRKYLERLAKDCEQFVEDEFDRAAIDQKILSIRQRLAD